MAERLPPETIELVLSLAFEPPGAEDVDVERERERRDLLRTAALVCRRWRPVATAMLPLSIVIGTADELAAHSAAHVGGTLDVGRTTGLTIACFDRSGDGEARLHALATSMPQLHYFRLACSANVRQTQLQWSGQHMVVGDLDCRNAWHISTLATSQCSDRALMDILDASPSFRHLSILVADRGFRSRIGAAFSARVETIRCGRPEAAFFCDNSALLVGHGDHLKRLKRLRYYGADFEDAVDTLTGDAHSSGTAAACPTLVTAFIGLGRYHFGHLYVNGEHEYAVTLLNWLPRSCVRLDCEVYGFRGAGRLLAILARAVGSADWMGIETLIAVIRDSETVDLQRHCVDEVAALEQACAAKGVAVEVRVYAV